VRREQGLTETRPVEVLVSVLVTLRGGKAERAEVMEEDENSEGLIAFENDEQRMATDDEADMAEEYIEEKLDTKGEVAFETYTGEWSWSEAKARTRELFVSRGFNALWHEVETMAKESFERGLRQGRRMR